MFWTLAILSMIAYTVQGVLMTKYARSIDPMSAGFYRSATLIFTMLPLLYFTSWEKILTMGSYISTLLLAGLLGALSQWTRFVSIRILPVGIHSALSMGLTVIFSFLFAFLLFGETATGWQWLFSAVIVAGAAYLSLNKIDMSHLDSQKWSQGITWVLLTAFFVSCAFILTIKVAREYDPYIAGYFWEAFIALAALGMLLVRKAKTGQNIEPIAISTFWKLALVCSPTIVGTGAFLLANTMGPVGVISAIESGGIVVGMIMSWMLYNEKLESKHLFGMGVVMIGIIGLKLF